MESISESIRSSLEREGIEYKQAEKPGMLTFVLASDNGDFFGYVAASEEERVVRVHIMVPPKAPIPKRHAVAELFVRINERVALGGFQLNMDDGAMAHGLTGAAE
jgi:hypothetical protein